ncbi:hypothetical protein DFS34DRAFT_651528 [Phlyctochytrium arcticum]|nr:hypothetical protein DFS34DRAFT_651528 [Phlyctochytrium arcticum]
MAAATILSVLLAVLVSIIYSWYRWFQELRARRSTLRAKLGISPPTPLFAFFHPFCDVGGGGERVLWVAVKAVQQAWPEAVLVIYAWDRAKTVEEVATTVKAQFNISISPSNLRLIPLKRWPYLEARRYKAFTLLGQSIGSMVVAWEALEAFLPDVFIDTMGMGFMYPVAKCLFRCRVVSYTHYPTISSDMLGKITSGTSDYNNSERVARSKALTAGKTIYYHLFAILYSLAGRTADIVLVNSTWTLNHINDIYRIPSRTRIVYPPCTTTDLTTYPLTNRHPVILSIAQFRPEKNHALQVRALSGLFKARPALKGKVKMVMVGGVRHAEDQRRVQTLKALIQELGLKDSITILENAAYETLQLLLRQSSIGLHSMQDEHFGIGIVEYMAAGLIPIAHNSGGPKLDIIRDGVTGLLATTVDEYVACLEKVLVGMSELEVGEMRSAARESVRDRFSERQFVDGFVDALGGVLDQKQRESRKGE